MGVAWSDIMVIGSSPWPMWDIFPCCAPKQLGFSVSRSLAFSLFRSLVFLSDSGVDWQAEEVEEFASVVRFVPKGWLGGCVWSTPLVLCMVAVG